MEEERTVKNQPFEADSIQLDAFEKDSTGTSLICHCRSQLKKGFSYVALTAERKRYLLY